MRGDQRRGEKMRDEESIGNERREQERREGVEYLTEEEWARIKCERVCLRRLCRKTNKENNDSV